MRIERVHTSGYFNFFCMLAAFIHLKEQDPRMEQTNLGSMKCNFQWPEVNITRNK